MVRFKRKNYSSALLNGRPLLDAVIVKDSSSIDYVQFPFSLPIVKNLKEIKFPTQITFFVGENGAGKSTLLEAIAMHVGFGAEGGSKNIAFKTAAEDTYSAAQKLAEHLTLSWHQKPRDGYFFRAESFYNVASKIDEIGDGIHQFYGDKSLHSQSHGESFFAFFQNRMHKDMAFFILDEPEAALSPQRQLSLLVLINELCKESSAQFIIATHSPILLACPNATIYSCDAGALTQVAYKDTEHYKITKQFLDAPERYLQHLLVDD